MENLTPEEAKLTYSFLNRVKIEGINEAKNMTIICVKLEAIINGTDIPRAAVTPITAEAEG